MRLKRHLNETKLNINQIDILDKIILTLEKECSLFLRELKRCDGLLYRGVNSSNKDIFKKRVRNDRYPKDMMKELHDDVDDMFWSIHGWRARSEGSFVSGSTWTVKTYGKPFLYFPIGKYEYLWSQKIDDLHEELQNNVDAEEMYEPDEIYHDDWIGIFGENGDGTWSYNGNNTGESDKDDAIQWVMNNFEDDFDSYVDEDNLDWYPEMSLEAYAEERRGKIKDNIQEIIEGYQKTYLKNAIDSKNEIMFRCKEYYLVNTIYEESLSTIIIKGRKMKQQKLPFKRK